VRYRDWGNVANCVHRVLSGSLKVKLEWILRCPVLEGHGLFAAAMISIAGPIALW
jgi:hypothetical protein